MFVPEELKLLNKFIIKKEFFTFQIIPSEKSQILVLYLVENNDKNYWNSEIIKSYKDEDAGFYKKKNKCYWTKIDF